jgi:hypothetical protein
MSASTEWEKPVWELTAQDTGKEMADMSWAMNKYTEHGDPEIVGWG